MPRLQLRLRLPLPRRKQAWLVLRSGRVCFASDAAAAAAQEARPSSQQRWAEWRTIRPALRRWRC